MRLQGEVQRIDSRRRDLDARHAVSTASRPHAANSHFAPSPLRAPEPSLRRWSFSDGSHGSGARHHAQVQDSTRSRKHRCRNGLGSQFGVAALVVAPRSRHPPGPRPASHHAPPRRTAHRRNAVGSACATSTRARAVRHEPRQLLHRPCEPRLLRPGVLPGPLRRGPFLLFGAMGRRLRGACAGELRRVRRGMRCSFGGRLLRTETDARMLERALLHAHLRV